MLIVLPIGHEVYLRRPPVVTIGLLSLLILIFIPTYLIMHNEHKSIHNLQKELLEKGLTIAVIEDTTEGEPTGAIFTFVELKDMSPDQVINYFLERSQKKPQAFAEWLNLYEQFQDDMKSLFVKRWGFVPADFPSLGFFTSIFLHANLLHLLGNLWFLYLAAIALEGIINRLMFVILFIASGLFANFIHLVMYPQSEIACIGSSGAIAGLIGMFAVVFAHEKINMFYGMVLFIRPVVGTFRAAAWSMVVLWFLVQIFWALMTYDLDIPVGVAYWAHIGGLAFGVACAFGFGLRIPQHEENYLILPDIEKAPEPLRSFVESPILTRVNAMLQNREFEKALSYCKKILVTAPSNRDATLAIARVYRQMGKLEYACLHMLNLLQQVASRSDRELLIQIYEEFRKGCPETQLGTDLAAHVGLAYASMNRFGDAIPMLQQVSDDGTSSPDIRTRAIFNLARIFQHIDGERNMAEHYCALFLKLFPQHEWSGAIHDILNSIRRCDKHNHNAE